MLILNQNNLKKYKIKYSAMSQTFYFQEISIFENRVVHHYNIWAL